MLAGFRRLAKANLHHRIGQKIGQRIGQRSSHAVLRAVGSLHAAGESAVIRAEKYGKIIPYKNPIEK
jgi:hypothetical protein